MNSTQLLNQVGELASQLGALDSDVAELKQQLRSFTGEADDSALYALPPEFDYDAAQQKLTELLKSRHATNVKLIDADEKYKTARKAEIQKKLAAIRAKYADVASRILQAACTIALAVKEGDNLIHEAGVAAGFMGAVQHCGPSLAGWSPDDHSSFVGHWLREGVRLGYITGKEQWLAGVTF